MIHLGELPFIALFFGLSSLLFNSSAAVELYETSPSIPYLLKQIPLRQSNPAASSNRPIRISIDKNRKRQTIHGFGGAFTEASAINFYKLPPQQREQILELYFGEKGLGYTVGRVHINSCDFSVASYSFDDKVDDFNLDSFDTNVTHDQETMIPFIKAAMQKSARPIRIFASPWSPPAWMKRENKMGQKSMVGSAEQNGIEQDPKYLASWALYFSKFLTAYKAQGIHLWGVTVQNEPEFAAPWEACMWAPYEQTNFIKNYLGPQLAADHPGTKIFAFDHNKDHLVIWASIMYADTAAAAFIDGMAFHWYTGDQFYHLEAVHALAPEKMLFPSEACNCPGVRVGDWRRGESYAHDIMGDLTHWAIGWTDWNLIVDQKGGPNHLGNMCDACIIADLVNQRVIIQPSYYFMGHFSKFLTPGSRVVKTLVERQHSPTAATIGSLLVAAPCDSSSPFQQWEMTVTPAQNAPKWDFGNDEKGKPRGRTQVRISLRQQPQLCVAVAGSSIGDGMNVILDACVYGTVPRPTSDPASASQSDKQDHLVDGWPEPVVPVAWKQEGDASVPPVENIVNDWLWVAGNPEDVINSEGKVYTGKGSPASIVAAVSGKCLYVPDLSFQANTEVEIGSQCSWSWHEKGWEYDPAVGQIRDMGTSLCLAARNPSPVKAVAAVRKEDGRTVLVIQNQDSKAANFEVLTTPEGKENKEVLLRATSIPAHSIQTYIF
eukprot:gb/GEZN01002033.1/.p1 GENE.gb/GEZN01002033.1/~~gb/GEZN01002033.1/.p1  ORF type:complete len:717 (+),score=87.05 gb/GEZN01002033.1/:22-2172(+)